MRIRATVAALATLAIIMPTAAHAQRTVRTSSAQSTAAQPLEIGMDGAISLGLSDQGTTIQLPQQKVRVGYFFNDQISIEPALGFDRFSISRTVPNGAGGTVDIKSSDSRLALDIAALYHLGIDRAMNQIYIKPVIGFRRFAETDKFGSTTESESITFTQVGVGAGIKMPLFNRVATRLEAEFRNQLTKKIDATTTIDAQNSINLLFGLSFYTR